MCSPVKELEIEKSCVIHLGNLCREFRSGKLDEDCVSNMDETDFRVDMDSKKTYEYEGSSHVKYCDVVSGGQNFTMMVHVSGGRTGVIEPPFMVFQNKSGNYPIKGVPDNVAGICYRTGAKGWMDQRVLAELVQEKRFFSKGTAAGGKKRIVYVDNVSSHNMTPRLIELLKVANIELRYFPPNATHLLQPCDSFIIQAIKAAWHKLWDAKKAQDVLQGNFRDGNNGSGKLANPGKYYFLKLGARAVQMARAKKDEDGINFARKSMVMCGLSLDTDGVWRVSQLKAELQVLVARHRELFDSVVAGEYVGEKKDGDSSGDENDEKESPDGDGSDGGEEEVEAANKKGQQAEVRKDKGTESEGEAELSDKEPGWEAESEEEEEKDGSQYFVAEEESEAESQGV